MAHKYSNFDDAFADFTAYYAGWQSNLAQVASYLSSMMTYAEAGNWLYAFSMAKWAIVYLKNCHNVNLNMLASAPDQNRFFESIYWAGQSGAAYELTMSDILTTMLSATPAEVQTFIGIADAFRQSIWNRPFNREYYAALARGFEIWP